jgi:hypothetical protein
MFCASMEAHIGQPKSPALETETSIPDLRNCRRIFALLQKKPVCHCDLCFFCTARELR